MNGRDPRTGRFLPGNQIARGNKGNRLPKWGNKNAVVTGEHERIAVILDDGTVFVSYGRGKSVTYKLPSRRS